MIKSAFVTSESSSVDQSLVQLLQITMIQQCLAVTSAVQPVQRNDGSWSLEGFGKDAYLQSSYFTRKMFLSTNISFHVTMSADECYERVINNKSSFTNALFPVQKLPLHIGYIIPMGPEKIEFITGYNRSDGKVQAKDSATVFTNSHLLNADVYIWAFILLALLACFIFARVAILIFMKNRRWRVLLPIARREMSRVFYYSNDRFKLITLLFSLLLFFMTTSFLCLYKTSHVVIEQPSRPASYLESLEERTSLALFYDQFYPVSGSFQDAPSHSIKRRLWNKVISSHRKNSINLGSADVTQMFTLFKEGAFDLMVNKSICMAATLMMPFVRSFICSCSPEDQLYFVKQLADPSEPEYIYGTLVSRALPSLRPVVRKCRHVFETNLMTQSTLKILDLRDIIYPAMGTSRKHLSRQEVACKDEDVFYPDTEVKAIPLSYFNSFFAACAVVWLIAIIINYLENAS